jgi:hypothetical protein
MSTPSEYIHKEIILSNPKIETKFKTFSVVIIKKNH